MRYVLAALAAWLPLSCGKAPPATAHGKPVGHWVKELQNPDALKRKKAVEVLGNVGTADPQALPALIGAVKDPDPLVRTAAVQALLKIGPDAQDALPALSEAQKDPDPRVRSAAAKAVARVQGGK
jgi:HEAT repeat protein